jgi:hypothetical protein
MRIREDVGLRGGREKGRERAVVYTSANAINLNF